MVDILVMRGKRNDRISEIYTGLDMGNVTNTVYATTKDAPNKQNVQTSAYEIGEWEIENPKVSSDYEIIDKSIR